MHVICSARKDARMTRHLVSGKMLGFGLILCWVFWFVGFGVLVVFVWFWVFGFF